MITDANGKINLEDTLTPQDRELVGLLKSKIKTDPYVLEQVCKILYYQLGMDAAKYFQSLSDEVKAQACMEHVVIGLLSGDMKRERFKELINNGT